VTNGDERKALLSPEASYANDWDVSPLPGSRHPSPCWRHLPTWSHETSRSMCRLPRRRRHRAPAAPADHAQRRAVIAPLAPHHGASAMIPDTHQRREHVWTLRKNGKTGWLWVALPWRELRLGVPQCLHDGELAYGPPVRSAWSGVGRGGGSAHAVDPSGWNWAARQRASAFGRKSTRHNDPPGV